MAHETLRLGNFTLDLDGQTLVFAGGPIAMRQKTWLVLRALAERPGVLLSADELHESAWPGLAVTPQTLTNVISELRKVTRLDPAASLRIDTRYGRGYRLVVDARADADSPSATAAAATAPIFVGRATELRCLADLWQQARTGARRIVFITGTAGVGKTALIDALLRTLDADCGAGGRRDREATPSSLLIGRGRCVVREGEGEPYAPVLDALEDVSRHVDLVDDLRRFAPSWLAQMPWLMPPDQMMALRRSLVGTGSLRVLREGVRLLEAIAAQRPVLLVFEDLHGADASTVDLLAALIDRSAPARLMVLATYRAPDAMLRGGVLPSLTRRTQRAASVTRLALEPLASAAIREYLARRFGDPAFGAAITPALEEKSGGNPLFLRECVDALVERGSLRDGPGGWQLEAAPEAVRGMLPDGVRDLIREHLTRLSAAQIAILEAAGQVGMQFTVSVVAAAAAQPIEDAGRACHTLAEQGHFIVDDGERAMPDGSVVEAYRFSHALYQQALSERPTATVRRPLHARIGEQLEREYGSRSLEIAQRLAAHFGAAGQHEKQFMYLQFAALGALERRGYRDASELVRRAIDASRLLPDNAAYGLRRAELLLAYGNARVVLDGLGDDGARTAYDAARAEAERHGDVTLRFRAQLGRCVTALGRSAPDAQAIADDLVAVAEAGHPELLTVAHLYQCHVARSRGEFRALMRHAEIAAAALPKAAAGIPQEVCIEARVDDALASAHLHAGDLDAARRHWWRAATVARDRATSVDRVALLGHLAATAMDARDADAVLALADEASAVADELGLDHLPFPLLTAVCQAWARCALGRGTVAELARLIDARECSREQWLMPLMFIVLAETQLRHRDLAAAGAAHARAAAACGREPAWLADVARLAGDVAVATGAPATEAERHYRAAIELARCQGAALFEARARVGLSTTGAAP